MDMFTSYGHITPYTAAYNLQHVWFPTKKYLARFFLKKPPSDEQLILKAIILQNQSVSYL